MTTIENLEKQLADALAQVRQLREALEEYARGDDFASRVAVIALQAPAPRVFTVEEVRPLVEALEGCVDTPLVNIDFGRVVAALTHARKLGMEGA